MFEQHDQEAIESLMHRDVEFRQLFHKHRELDSKVRNAELGVLPMDDVTLQTLKKEKLRAKDRLTQMWETHQRS